MTVKLISILRVIIGLVFVVSGFGKLIDINEFANIVRSYGFFPFLSHKIAHFHDQVQHRTI